MSSADGVGFHFSSCLPSTQNIQCITSIFLTKSGHVCLRARKEILKLRHKVKRLEVGDKIEMKIDLKISTIEFIVWPTIGGHSSRCKVDFGAEFLAFSAHPSEALKFRGGYL